MHSSNEGVQPRPVARLPLWLSILGGIVFIGSAILAGRLTWEQTVWTWERGPQMVGFSLAHGPAAILLLVPFLLVLWTAAVAVPTVRSLIKKKSNFNAKVGRIGLGDFTLCAYGTAGRFLAEGLHQSNGRFTTRWRFARVRCLSRRPRHGQGTCIAWSSNRCD